MLTLRSRALSTLALILTCLASAVRTSADTPTSLFPPARNMTWMISTTKSLAVLVPDSASIATPSITFDASTVGEKAVTLTIKSDAKSIRINGKPELELPFGPKHPHTLGMSFDLMEPHLQFDGEDVADAAGAWQGMVASQPKSYTLELIAATYCNIHYKLGPLQQAITTTSETAKGIGSPIAASSSDLPVATVNEVKPFPQPYRAKAAVSGSSGTPAASQPAINATDLAAHGLGQTTRSVFQLVVRDSSKHEFASGTGFIVATDGTALTNFHVVRGAASALAKFSDRPDPLSVDLIAVSPDYDLAVVRVKFPDGEKLPAPLQLAPAAPAVGADVYAIGFPEMGLTATRGIISGVRQFKDLPPEFRDDGRYANDSQWLQTDCTINHGNSGGPLIGTDGSAVGINTWVALGTEANGPLHNTYFALSITHANDLLQNLPKHAMNFATCASNYTADDVDTGLPHLAIKRDQPAATITDRLATVVISIACSRCRGTGHITITEQTGTRHDGPFIVPIVSSEEVRCPECDGLGYNKVGFQTSIGHFFGSVAHSNPDAPNQKGILEKAASHLWALQEKYGRVFEDADMLHPGYNIDVKNPHGKGVVAMGQYDGVHVGTTLNTVTIGMHRVAMIDPVYCDASQGDKVIIGGMVAGTTYIRGVPTVVIEYGMIISENAKDNDKPKDDE
jgi:S1-C subfamily serine protease